MRPDPLRIAACLAVLVLGLLAGVVFNPIPDLGTIPVLLLCVLAAGQTGIAALLARSALLHLPRPGMLLLAAFLLAALLAVASVGVWPNSGDEYATLYLTRTLLHGRLSNAPAPSAALFEFNWIFEQGGKRLSQFAPAWSALLMPFVATGTQALAAPLATLAAGGFLLGALRRLGASAPAAAALMALSLLSPFALLNGASYFAMMPAAALVLAICWLQLREEAAPGRANRVALGFAFSVLLSTRYEVFALLLAAYLLDRLWRRRLALLADLPAILAGAAPLTAAFLAYNLAITGNPLLTPLQWLRPGFGVGLAAPETADALRAAFWNLQGWSALLLQVGGLALALLFLAGFAVKLRAGRLRFFDGLPLLAVGFFALFPELGGHMFGPRYWFFAFLPMALTASALPNDALGWLSLAGRRVHLPTLAAVHLLGFAATTLVVAGLFRAYVDQRRAPLLVAPPVLPAVVLVPSWTITLVPWQPRPYLVHSTDLTRNGPDFAGVTLYGRADAPDAVHMACALGRSVWRWQPGVGLRAQPCEGATPGR